MSSCACSTCYEIHISCTQLFVCTVSFLFDIAVHKNYLESLALGNLKGPRPTHATSDCRNARSASNCKVFVSRRKMSQDKRLLIWESSVCLIPICYQYIKYAQKKKKPKTFWNNDTPIISKFLKMRKGRK